MQAMDESDDPDAKRYTEETLTEEFYHENEVSEGDINEPSADGINEGE